MPKPPPYDWERTARWVRSFSRDRMGNRIERCLYTAWTEGDGDRILPLLHQLIVGLARFTTGARRSNNSDSATRTAKRFARRETAVDLY